MIYEIATHYHLDPKKIENEWTEYEYWEFKVFQIQQNKIEKWIFEQK